MSIKQTSIVAGEYYHIYNRGIEIKSNFKLPKAPPTWGNAYQNAGYGMINTDNWHKFIL